MKGTSLFGIVCGLSLASAIGDVHKLGSEGSAIGQVVTGLKTETKTKTGKGSKVVTESWKINVEGGAGCSCTASTFSSHDSLRTDCLSKLKHPCKVTVTEGIVPLGAARICQSGDKTSATARLDDFYGLSHLTVHKVEPGLAYSTNSSCVGTDRKVTYVTDNTSGPCSAEGSFSAGIPSSWTVDSSGRITTQSQEPLVSIDNERGSGDNTPVLHFTAGTGPGCTLSENTTDSQIHFSGVISDFEFAGSYYKAVLDDDSCTLPESCLSTFGDRHLFVNDCLAKIPNTCPVTIQGRHNIEMDQINLCNGADSVAYIPISEDFRGLTIGYSLEVASTGLKFASSSFVTCSNNPVTTPIAAKVDKTIWNERLCEGEPIKTPALVGEFQSDSGSNTNIYFYPRQATKIELGPDDFGLAISAGKADAGCTFAGSDWPSYIQFEGTANPSLLSSSALSYLSASSFFALLVVCFYV